MTFPAGTRVGKYELKKLLGQGGFGMVYVASDSKLDRDCALKFLLPEHTANPEILARFFREARSAARIDHPGIVTVFECDQVDQPGTPLHGLAFIAMELLRGESLADRLERGGALPVPVALEIVRQLASALAAAHRAGIVHRDLKPDNVFLCPDPASASGERVKVLDFGIAKLGEVQTSSARTGSLMIFGTPRYMSPEQCRSTANVDARSDIYALGVMLFEMLCGARPFDGEPGALIAYHQVVPPPKLRSRNPALPATLEDLVDRMLAKAPEHRPPSMDSITTLLADTFDMRRTSGGTPVQQPTLPLADSAPGLLREPFTPAGVRPAVVAAPTTPIMAASPSSPTPAPITPSAPPAELRAAVEHSPRSTPPPVIAQPAHVPIVAPSPPPLPLPDPSYGVRPYAPPRARPGVSLWVLGIIGLGVVGLIAVVLVAARVFRDNERPAATGPHDAAPFTPSLATLAVEDEDDARGAPYPMATYSHDPGLTLPSVAGTSSYKPLGPQRIVRFAVDAWPGWAALLFANAGAKPGKLWRDAKGGEFRVEVVAFPSEYKHGPSYSTGDVHVAGTVVDALPLWLSNIRTDPRLQPRIVQLVDWSNGGHGVVVGAGITKLDDLRGSKVATTLGGSALFGGLDVQATFPTLPAEVASELSSGQAKACALAAPALYELTANRGNRVLVSTINANKRVAHVWFARADFARDNPEIVEGLVRGILDAVPELAIDANRVTAGKHLEATFQFAAGIGAAMLADVHFATYADNRDFFLAANSPTNFERTLDRAHRELRRHKSIDTPAIEHDRVADFSILRKLESEPKYASQPVTYRIAFTASPRKVEAIATKVVTIRFAASSIDPLKRVGDVSYDGDVEHVIEDVALTASAGAYTRIVVEGHVRRRATPTDDAATRELAAQRARAVKELLLKRYPQLDPSKIVTTAHGSDRPVDPANPGVRGDRRVEISVVFD